MARKIVQNSESAPGADREMCLVVVREDTLFSNRLPALLHQTKLLRHITEPADDLLVPIIKGKDSVGNSGLPTKLQHILLRAAKVVAWHPRIEMVDGLELQPAVKEVQPCRAIDIHRSAQHLLGKGFMHAEVRG